MKGDIALSTLDVIDLFHQNYCIKGGVSTEVGSRAHKLHLQGIFRTRYPTAQQFQKEMNKFVKALLPSKGKGYRVLAKPLARTQDFVTMCGYILKDEGQPWFQHRVFNIPRYHLILHSSDLHLV
jgi:hypothetical protein